MKASGNKQVKESSVESELDQPVWSVISFDRCEASGLTHAMAEEKMMELECQNVAGLCIVTDEAARRINPV